MVERLLVSTVAVLIVASGCSRIDDADPDAPGEMATDAPRNTDFRDASGCSAGSGSGSASGAGCGSGSGSPAPPDAPPCDQVTFTYEGAAATSVWVTGSFTSWATMPPGARALVNGGAGRWSLTTRVGAGRHIYKLVLDGTRWIADPANPVREVDGFGGHNSVLVTCDVTP
jgi:hypothetical protein